MSEPSGGLVIYARDVAAVSEFYRSVLGMEIVARRDGYVALQVEEFEIVVVEVPTAIADSVVLTAPPTARESTPLKPMFVVSSLSEVRAAVTANGGTMKPPEAAWKFRGATVIDGCDCEGNVVQFRESERGAPSRTRR